MAKDDSRLAALRREATDRGVFGGSKVWAGVAAATWAIRGLQLALRKEEVVVVEDLQPGDQLMITHRPPTKGRKARKAQRRAAEKMALARGLTRRERKKAAAIEHERMKAQRSGRAVKARKLAARAARARQDAEEGRMARQALRAETRQRELTEALDHLGERTRRGKQVQRLEADVAKAQRKVEAGRRYRRAMGLEDAAARLERVSAETTGRLHDKSARAAAKLDKRAEDARKKAARSRASTKLRRTRAKARKGSRQLDEQLRKKKHLRAGKRIEQEVAAARAEAEAARSKVLSGRQGRKIAKLERRAGKALIASGATPPVGDL